MSGSDSNGNDEVADTIEAILMLWQIFTPAENIAKRLHLPTSDIQHVIDHGCFPAKQMKLNWADIEDSAPTDSASTDSRSYDFGRENQR